MPAELASLSAAMMLWILAVACFVVSSGNVQLQQRQQQQQQQQHLCVMPYDLSKILLPQHQKLTFTQSRHLIRNGRGHNDDAAADDGGGGGDGDAECACMLRTYR
jgi:hypothetical protein